MDFLLKKGPQNSKKVARTGPGWVPSCKRSEKKGPTYGPFHEKRFTKQKKIARIGPGWYLLSSV